MGTGNPRGLARTALACRRDAIAAGAVSVLFCLLAASGACVHENEQTRQGEIPEETAESSDTTSEAPQPAPTGDTAISDADAASPRIYDRVLVRPVAKLAIGEVELREAIARQVAAPIERISKGPLQWRVILFEARDPPRDAAAQKELVKSLRALPELEKVEADQLMFAQ